MAVNIPMIRRLSVIPVRVSNWFTSSIHTQSEAEAVLRVVWMYFAVTIGAVMFGGIFMFMRLQSKGFILEFPFLNELTEAATLLLVYLMRARKSRLLAIVLFLSVLIIAGQSLYALGNLSSLSYQQILMMFHITSNLFISLIAVAVSLVNVFVMHKAVTATFRYHHMLQTEIIWRHIPILGAVVFIGVLAMSLGNEVVWNALKGPLNLSDYSTEIEGRLNVCWIVLSTFLCSMLLASRFPMTKPSQISTTMPISTT